MAAGEAIGKARIDVEVNAESVDAGIASAKASIGSLGETASAAGARASAGLGQAATAAAKVGDAAAPAAQKVDRATRSIETALQRQIAVMQAGERGSRAYWEALGGQRQADLSRLRPYLDQIDQLRTKQQSATAAIAATGPALNQVGMSARATAAAMRGVPAQITDIFVSLQGGQRPMTVLLQQGGQLKDMFGGIVPAARALTTSLLGMVTPTMVVVGAAVALGAAWNKGRQESVEYQKALILSGNAAGTTASRMSDMAAAISRVQGTQGAAAAGLAEFARSGQIAERNLQQFTEAALRFERVTGTAVRETVKQFEELARSPTAASVKLNETYNYLTDSVYRQIKALEDQGRTTEAANLAQRAFADTLQQRSGQIMANLGLIERGWNAIKGAISGAVSAMAGVGRATSASEQLEATRARLRQLQEAEGAGTGFGSTGGGAAVGRPSSASASRAAEIETLREALRLGERAAQAASEEAEAKARGAAQTRASIEYDRLTAKLATDKVKMEREIALVRSTGLQAKRDEKDIERDIARIREGYEKKTPKAPKGPAVVDTDLANLRARIREEEGLTAAIRQRGTEAEKMNEGERLAAQIAEQVAGATTKKARAHLQEKAALASRLGETIRVREAEAAYADTLRDFSKLQADAEARTDGLSAAQRKLLEYLTSPAYAQHNEQQRQAVLEKGYAAVSSEKLKTALEAESKATAALVEENAKAIEAQQQGAARLRDQVRQEQEALEAYGLSAVALAQLAAARLRDAAAAKDRQAAIADDIDFSGEMSRRLRQEAADLRALADARVEGAVRRDEFDRLREAYTQLDGLGQELWRDFTEGGSNAARRVGQTLKRELLDMLYRMTVQRWTLNIAANVTGAGQGAVSQMTGGVGNIAGTASQIGSAYTVGAQYLGGTMSGLNALGTIGANATGTGISGLLATNGAYGTAAAGTASAAAGGASAALAAIPVWGWIALGAIALYSMIGKGGETRSGGKYNTGKFVEGPSGGPIGGDGAMEAANITRQGIDATLRRIGSAASINTFESGLESSKEGKGFAYAGGSLTAAGGLVSFGQRQDAGGYMNRRGDMSPQEAFAAYQQELKQATLQALQAATDVPRVIADKLTGVDIDALTDAQLDELLQSIGAVIQEVETFAAAARTMPFAEVRDLSFAASAALLEFAGGIDNLLNGMRAYSENFFTEEEQRWNSARNIADTLTGAGFQDIEAVHVIHASRETFRSIVEGLDLTTESGRRQYAAMMSVAGAFAELIPATETAAEAVRDVAAEMAELDRIRREATDRALAHLARMTAIERETVQASREAAVAVVQEIGSVFEMLRDNARDLYAEGATGAMAAEQGRGYISQALATARATGYLPDGEALGGAIGAARAGLDADSYATASDREFDRLVLAGQLRELAEIAEPQLTAAERAVKTADLQLEALDKQLDYWRDAIGYARDELQAITSVEDAVHQLREALTDENPNAAHPPPPASSGGGGGGFAGVQGNGSGGGGGGAMDWGGEVLPASQIGSYVRGMSGWGASVNSDEINLIRLAQTARASGWTPEDIAAALGMSPEEVRSRFLQSHLAHQIPGFAAGGSHAGGWAIVGERGPELAYMPPARIYNARETGSILSGNADLITEIRALRTEVTRLGVQTVINTAKAADKLERIDEGGVQTRPIVEA